MTDEEREKIASEITALKALCCDAHKAATAGKITTCCFCVCGSGMGGPVGSAACRALRRIKELLETCGSEKRKMPAATRREIEEVVWHLH